MLKKTSIVLVILLFIITAIFVVPHKKFYRVEDVMTPCDIKLSQTEFRIKEYECLDTTYTERNKIYASKLRITEDEAFLLANVGKNRAINILKGRFVTINGNAIHYFKYDYNTKLFYSGFCFKDFKPCLQDAFDFQLEKIRKANYVVLDLETYKVYQVGESKVKSLKNFLVVRKSHLPKDKNKFKKAVILKDKIIAKPKMTCVADNIKLFLTDGTTKLFPDRSCSTDMCKELVNNINSSKKSIDMAIYGYSDVPDIKKALVNAQKRGVKIRLVYDNDSKGGNIYSDTNELVKILADNSNDKVSKEANNIMHNKFYIFDDKILITGSANLAHTDMSGYNSNSMVVINSKGLSQVYKQEFEQMFNGKFHNDKAKIMQNKKFENIEVYFSPKDKVITNLIIPLLKNAKDYIYIPTFVLTDRKVTGELIEAQKRGVEVKIITDALNASTKHTKIKELRNAGILVKSENYAGKMHSKTIIIDDKYLVTGSMNFSYSGENRNDENVLLIENSELAQFYKQFFLYQWSRIDNYWLKHNPRAEGKDSIGSCSDGMDNNYDGFTDIQDPACRIY